MRRTLYKPLGFIFLAIGLVGVLLPVLPTTPFLLVSAWFFARSSEKWHQWLLRNELFGPPIRNWEENRCISARTKLVALLAMLGAGTASIVFAVEVQWLRYLAIGMMTLGCITVVSIPTCPPRD